MRIAFGARFWAPGSQRPKGCSEEFFFFGGRGHFARSKLLGKRTLSQGALKGTNLRGQTERKRRFSQIFADSRRFS